MLIMNNGDKGGLVPIARAIEMSQEAKLDLVQVSDSDANPVVCKMLDYGKHMFEKRKSILPQNQKQKKHQ